MRTGGPKTPEGRARALANLVRHGDAANAHKLGNLRVPERGDILVRLWFTLLNQHRLRLDQTSQKAGYAPQHVREMGDKHTPSSVMLQNLYEAAGYQLVPMLTSQCDRYLCKLIKPLRSARFEKHRQRLPHDAQQIQSIVAKELDLTSSQILSGDRRAPVARARHLAMMLAHECAGGTLAALAPLFNRADHTTIMHGVQQARRRIAEDPNEALFAAVLEGKIRKRLRKPIWNCRPMEAPPTTAPVEAAA